MCTEEFSLGKYHFIWFPTNGAESLTCLYGYVSQMKIKSVYQLMPVLIYISIFKKWKDLLQEVKLSVAAQVQSKLLIRAMTNLKVL